MHYKNFNTSCTPLSWCKVYVTGWKNKQTNKFKNKTSSKIAEVPKICGKITNFYSITVAIFSVSIRYQWQTLLIMICSKRWQIIIIYANKQWNTTLQRSFIHSQIFVVFSSALWNVAFLMYFLYLDIFVRRNVRPKKNYVCLPSAIDPKMPKIWISFFSLSLQRPKIWKLSIFNGKC